MKKQEYNTIHKWVQYNFKKTGVCEHCDTSGLTGRYIHWANVSGKYKKQRSDWKELCAKCHQIFDKRYKEGSLLYAICLNCKDAFNISPSRIGKKYYCSSKCFAEYRTGIPKNNWKLNMEVV